MSFLEVSILSLLILTISVFGDPWDHIPNECGTTRLDKMRSTTRIMHGDKAKLGQFPWLARIAIFDKTGRFSFEATGALINRYYVVTVAFLKKMQKAVQLVRVGDNYDTAMIDCDEHGVCAPPHQDIKPKKFIAMEEYSPFSSENDIMLIELEQPAEFNDFVSPICMIREAMPLESVVGKGVTVAGWGLANIKQTVSYPFKLRYATLTVADADNCPVASYSKSVFCAVDEDQQAEFSTIEDFEGVVDPNWFKKSICMGDTGTPLALSIEVDGVHRYYLLGLGLYTHPMECGFASPFTNVTKYVDFILENIERS